MTLEEVYTLLSRTGLPVCYKAWPEGAAPSLPYICFFFFEADNFAADGIVYHSSMCLAVELYTEKKDEASEALVETALADHYYDKEESYIESEKCYQISYELEV